MVLVDTSIWITHLREGSSHLQDLLRDGQVVCHPFIVGELVLGNMRNRAEILALLQTLAMAPTVGAQELLYFVEQHRLMGTGIGFVDAHLLASALLSKLPLWTSDTKLRKVAMKLGVAYR